MELTPEQERDSALTELARLRAGLAVGLSVEQSARLQGATDEELTADAEAFAAELGLTGPPAPPAPRVGGPRGIDVGNGAGTVTGGAQRYRQRHGIDEDGRRPERRHDNSDGRNPFAERTYTMNGR
ncbi:hypothetical protein [Streptomyces purpurascens]|uniref:hypothetical protein n=1 Tax=Streptomyces purpurascens TaxID=1924 RepID=UPI001677662C|nr:hypothetical protein [Streptomyces purpurascens]MCE7050644.1 hypothetical protein [Streptomyces purpurascens]GHA35525.1 hypothetical protein GCM10010303_52850 [Streptomyces purpurascens]